MSENRQGGEILNNQKGFTLIELVIVIVILGILAVVAVPRYADMQTEANEAAADGVFGAAEGAAAINFAAGLTGATQPAGGVIDSGTDLLAAMDGNPEGWEADDTTPDLGICLNPTTTGDCSTAIYAINITTAEDTDSKAVLSKAGW